MLASRTESFLALLFLAAALLAGCPRSSANTQSTPELALAELARVGGDGARLYDLLDQDSRWSVMTVLRELREFCQLVRDHYPKARQARELLRCRAAESLPQPRAFFGAQAAGWGMLAGLQGLTGKEVLQGSGDRRTAIAPGHNQPLLFCRGDEGWSYCGLREELERLKLKTTRDLDTARENAEAFKGR